MQIKCMCILIVFFLLGAANAGADINSGLVGWWRFDETSGNAVDSSNYANTGTPSGTTLVANCQKRGCRNFNGTGDYVSIPSSTNYNGTTSTWCVWFKTSGGFGAGTGTTISTLLGRHDTGASNNGVNILLSTAGAITFETKDGSSNRPFQLSTAALYTDNNWHQVCGVTAPNGGTASLYMDGVFYSSAVASWTWAFNGQVVRIADSIDTFWGQYKGLIDDVRIYNRALNAQEIRDLYIPGAVLRGAVLSGAKINQR